MRYKIRHHVSTKLVIILFTSLLTIGCSGKINESGFNDTERPNILFLVSEDHGPQLGIYGDPFARTPILDRLGENGVVFDRAYVSQAGCSPSRSTLMTGLYPHQNGQIGLATHGFKLYDSESILLLPNALKDAGYRTGIVGKLHINPESAFDFDDELGGDSFGERDVRKVARNAMKFITETGSSQPFFLSVNYADVHRPYIGDNVRQADGLPEDPHDVGEVDILPQIGFYDELQENKAANYYNSIERLDAGIGILLEELKETGQFENTIIIFISDHGSDMLRGKRTVYEAGTKIPMIIHWGNRIKTGQRINELVSTIDLFPTFLELAGIDIPKELPGRSLIPFLKGQNTEWREYLYTEYHIHSPHNLYPQRTVRNDRFKLIHNLHHGQFNPGYAFTFDRIYDSRTEIENVISKAPNKVQNTYSIRKSSPEYELYDLDNDPHEFNNLANNESFKDIREHLKKKLHDWRIKTKDPLLSEKNLNYLSENVKEAYENEEYLIENEEGHMVLGDYNRVRRGDDHWWFYEEWKSYLNMD
ncbi:MAG: sulfatase [Candidatus Paceibacterota bacterium]